MIKLIGCYSKLNEGVSDNGKPYRYNNLHIYVEHDQGLPENMIGDKASYMQVDLDKCTVFGQPVKGCDVSFEYSIGRDASIVKVVFS